MARTEPLPRVDVTQPPPERQDRFTPSPAGWAGRAAVYAVLAFVVVGLPAMRPDFEMPIFTRGVVFAIVALSLNVLIGYTGQISLGHQAFVGFGAFTSAYMVSVANQEFPIAIAVAITLGALQAGVLGLVALRVRGLYFALVTLSYGLLAEASLFKINALTGGAAGQPAPKPPGFDTPHRYYYLCLALLAVVLWVDYRLMQTKGGRALLALRENPRVAYTFGVDVKLYTLFAFMVAGGFAGLGGALFAHNDTNVSSVVFDFRLALVFIIMTVVGGLRSRVGVVIGGAFFALLGFIVEHLPGLHEGIPIPGLPDLAIEDVEFVFGPILLLLTLTQFPGGIGQQIRPLQQWLSGKRFDIHDRGAEEVTITDVRA